MKTSQTRLLETDTKLKALLSKLHNLRVDWALLAHELNVLRPPLNAPKDPKVQSWPKLAQSVHSMLISMPSLWTL
jgi:hypothetical protein